MTIGDKAIQNEGLPEFIKRGSPNVISDYFRQMWVEDGNFKANPSCSSAEYQWDRGVVLCDPTRNVQYGLECKATEPHLDLVREFGTHKESSAFGSRFELSGGSLKRLTRSNDPVTAKLASELKRIALENSSKLMEDERELLGEIGVKTASYFVKVTLYEGTGRLSTLWHGRTRDISDAMRVGILAPPDDNAKRLAVEEWIKAHPLKAQEVKAQLKMEGLI